MISDEHLHKIGFILDQLERRVTSLEAMSTEMQGEIRRLQESTGDHTQSLTNLSERMSHESLSILDIIGDMQAKLDPLYDRFVPGFGSFKAEIGRFFERRRRPQ